ncbi:sigma 54-interacting transcriptional regulator [Tindallia californiensis]|uniref:PAS domain S-box-containing protein n=1 Tax=Tindallia californiensis TaxID=159292 RepID=A0A1H3QRC0_9FIRM|nr:sigma 54-interacting transcriptional regulator [Tindallia californiensis]SDZ15880.1 PAS domain S-box-containing protein [Tindallia californiensis]
MRKLEKICFIAPYEEIFKLTEKVCKKTKTKITIKRGNLEEGIVPAKQAEMSGAQVIISRGGTASIIRQNVSIPVVEVRVTGHDLLKSLYPYRKNESIIGVVGYKNVVEGCQTISEILEIPIQEIIIPNDEAKIDWLHVENKVNELVSIHKIEALVGDTTIISKLPSLNIAVKLITSGQEAIIQAIEEAIHISSVRETEKEKRKRFEAVLDFVNDGVLATDEEGTITVINPIAEKIFGIKKEEVIGHPVTSIISNTEIMNVIRKKSGDIQKIQKVGSGHIVTNRIPIMVNGTVKGVVATFQDVSAIQGAEQKIRQKLYAKGLVTRYNFKDFITKNKKMKRLIIIAQDFAKTDATVLICGESGTGKEILAQSIHSLSSRKDGPFVAVNCAALSSQLLESELFGYEEGAFTGAKKSGKIGHFELAHKGTIFLDEMGEMDKNLQARLLRVLEEKQIMRLGSDKIIPVDIRIIAATNLDLKAQVKQGAFRMDLYYRLNVLKLQTIPLRERQEDIAYLSKCFLRSINQKYGRQIEGFSEDVMPLLIQHTWPGNVRELKNIIERLVLSAKGDYITLRDAEFLVEELKNDFIGENKNDSEYILEGTMKDIKRKVITKILKEEGDNKSRTARRLELDRSTVDKYLK